MASSSHSQRRAKPKLEPITSAELASDSTMMGFSDLFRIPIASNFPAPIVPSGGTEECLGSSITEGTPLSGTPITDTPHSNTLDSNTPRGSGYDSSEVFPQENYSYISKKGTLCEVPVKRDSSLADCPNESDTALQQTSIGRVTSKQDTAAQGTPFYGSRPLEDIYSLAALGLTVEPPQLKQATLAQHAHTQGEELLYSKMWGKGNPLPSQPCRILTAGIKKLTALMGLSKTDNCRNNLDGLIDKLAIDDLGVAPNPNLGHVYRIWDQSAILQRRRNRGLTHYYKLRRGVYLVNPNIAHDGVPQSGVPQKRRSQDEVPQGREPIIEDREPSNGDPPELGRVPTIGLSRVPQNSPRLNRNRNIQEDNDDEEVPVAVVDALLSVMGECDDHSAKRIVTAARTARPSIPDQVVVQIIHMKGPRIRANRSLDYPLRILELSVAETARGVTGANLCRAQARAISPQMDSDVDSWRRRQEAALLDPEIGDAEKELIRRSLKMI